MMLLAPGNPATFLLSQASSTKIFFLPSPAADYVERHISLDEKFIEHPAATYFMRAGRHTGEKES